ncbi:MAG TPA: hypothetical protein VFQ41_14070 [Candidatus Angelobacter sp.]|nr:hypothetical protein [Candidatus Angelobacter sp.]
MDVPKPTSRKAGKTKEEIIAAVQEAARQLGRAPRSREFTPLSGISLWQVAGRFGGYCNAVRAAGLQPSHQGVKVETAALLEDWGRVVRKVGAVPTRTQYMAAGSHAPESYSDRFESWVKIPEAFTRFVATGALGGDWTDVVEKIRKGPIPQKGESALRAWYKAAKAAYEARNLEQQGASTNPPTAAGTIRHLDADLDRKELNAEGGTPLPPPLAGKKCVTATMLAVFVAELAPSAFPMVTAACFVRRPLPDRPMLGAPTRPCGLAYEPVNEMGVMALFCMLSRQLGFVIESVQSGFPDCEAKMEVEPGRWQHFRIEFEYESRNFRDHRHDPDKCDLIVCWRHNWKDCPANLQVLELSKVMAQL